MPRLGVYLSHFNSIYGWRFCLELEAQAGPQCLCTGFWARYVQRLPTEPYGYTNLAIVQAFFGHAAQASTAIRLLRHRHPGFSAKNSTTLRTLQEIQRPGSRPQGFEGGRISRMTASGQSRLFSKAAAQSAFHPSEVRKAPLFTSHMCQQPTNRCQGIDRHSGSPALRMPSRTFSASAGFL